MYTIANLYFSYFNFVARFLYRLLKKGRAAGKRTVQNTGNLTQRMLHTTVVTRGLVELGVAIQQVSWK